MRVVSLADYVKEKGQVTAAATLGVHQTAISKAIRTKRNVNVIQQLDGTVRAEEIKPFPNHKPTCEEMSCSHKS